jgi:GNAT superfamily N-acetyltransferase
MMALGGYRLRPFQTGDEAACVALWTACDLVVWYNDPAADIALFRSSENADVLLAERDGEIIGSICVGHDGHRGWMYYLAVARAYRRQGIGRRLVRAAEDWAKSRGIRKIELMVRPDKEAVRAFYEALGYALAPVSVFARWLEDIGTAPASKDAKPTLVAEDGMIETVITYLEMRARPSLPPVPPPRSSKIALLRADAPTTSFYRYLYDTVGEPWLWWERRLTSEDELAAILADDRVDIYVLYADGMPAGFAELDRRRSKDVELAYFGLMPNFIGRGFGPYLLYSAIEIAWTHEPQRLCVNTCTFDHPKALALYQSMGFQPYAQERKTIIDPRLTGVL